jgi:hypothetical protein
LDAQAPELQKGNTTMHFKTILIAVALTAFAGSAVAAPTVNPGAPQLHAKKLMQLAGCQHQRGKASGGGATGGGSSSGA